MLMRLVISVFLVLMIHSVTGRSIRGMISDGMDGIADRGQDLSLKSTTVTCTPTYGFLPCTTELWGELFLIIVYEYLLAAASHYVSTGSDLFFRMFGTGIFGATVFQMLGMIPQVVIMLVSVLSADSDTIESMAAMMMAMIAGSAITSFTLVWGSVIVFGSHDLSDPDGSSASSTSSSSFLSLPTFMQLISSNYGVETDTDAKKVASIVLLSMIPILVLQLAKILSSSAAQRVVILIALIITLAFLAAYVIYESFKPWIQVKRYEYLLRMHVQESILKKYLTKSGKPNESLIKLLFNRIDKNKNSQISETELSAFILGIQIEEEGFSNADDYVQRVLKEFDTSQDSQINEQEFVDGVKKWLGKTTTSPSATRNGNRKNPSKSTSQSTGSTEEQQSLISQGDSGISATTSTSKPSGKPWWNYTKAGFFILLGTGISILIGMPLMLNIQGFATAAGIPSFLVSYVVVPLAMGSMQAIGIITTARKKTVKDISLSFSEVYNGVFMNNVMGLSMFLLLVYIEDIAWDVSAEVLLVLLICTLMGCLSSFITKFPLWIGILAYLLYPISLVLLYLLTSVLGWS